jgi:hypothetical protein
MRAWLLPLLTLVLVGGFLVVSMAIRHQVPEPAPAKIDLAPAAHITTRNWKAMAADPAASSGKRVYLWGQVTRVDAAARTVRANVDAARHAPSGGKVNYPTAVLMHGDVPELGTLRTGYVFTAEATVDPPAAPGAEPVMRLTVTSLRVTDKTVG